MQQRGTTACLSHFPAFSLVKQNGDKINIEVVYDPRATMCPIAKEKMPLDRSFIKEVKKAARYLSRDEKMLEYMKAVSEEITEIIDLKEKLEGFV